MTIISIIKEAAPCSSETLEEYVENISHMVPEVQLQVNNDLENMSKVTMSSTIIELNMILEKLNKDDERDLVYRSFILHHLDYYTTACWD